MPVRTYDIFFNNRKIDGADLLRDARALIKAHEKTMQGYFQIQTWDGYSVPVV